MIAAAIPAGGQEVEPRPVDDKPISQVSLDLGSVDARRSETTAISWLTEARSARTDLPLDEIAVEADRGGSTAFRIPAIDVEVVIDFESAEIVRDSAPPWPLEDGVDDSLAAPAPITMFGTETAWLNDIPVITASLIGSGKDAELYIETSFETFIAYGCEEGVCVSIGQLNQVPTDKHEHSHGPVDTSDPAQSDDRYAGIEFEEAPRTAGQFEGRSPANSVTHLNYTPQVDVLIVRLPGATSASVAAELNSMNTGQGQQGIRMRFEVVGDIAMSWPGSPTDKYETLLPQIGNSTAFINKRTEYRADLVLVVAPDLDVAGSASGIPSDITRFSGTDLWYVVVRDTASTGSSDPARVVPNRTVPHELGHLAGLRHGWCSDPIGTGHFAYRHGFVNFDANRPEGYQYVRTLMANRDENDRTFTSCEVVPTSTTRIPRWSTRDNETYSLPVYNPATSGIDYYPVPLGTLDARPDVSGNQQTDNERAWEEDAWNIASYKFADVCPFGTVGFTVNGVAPSTVRFVNQIYNDFLGRNPDTGGMAFWDAELLNNTQTADQTIVQFVRSPEFEGSYAEVIRMYHILQDRSPDVGGLEFWGKVNTNRQTLAAGLLAETNPFNWGAMTDAQFVDTLWPRAFGTTPSSYWRNVWINRLAGSWTRPMVAENWATQQTLSATRWQTTVDASMLYYGMLDRAPDSGGLSFWTNQLNNGMAYTEATRLFRGGTEYRNRIGVSTGC